MGQNKKKWVHIVPHTGQLRKKWVHMAARTAQSKKKWVHWSKITCTKVKTAYQGGRRENPALDQPWRLGKVREMKDKKGVGPQGTSSLSATGVATWILQAWQAATGFSDSKEWPAHPSSPGVFWLLHSGPARSRLHTSGAVPFSSFAQGPPRSPAATAQAHEQ